MMIEVELSQIIPQFPLGQGSWQSCKYPVKTQFKFYEWSGDQCSLTMGQWNGLAFSVSLSGPVFGWYAAFLFFICLEKATYANSSILQWRRWSIDFALARHMGQASQRYPCGTTGYQLLELLIGALPFQMLLLSQCLDPPMSRMRAQSVSVIPFDHREICICEVSILATFLHYFVISLHWDACSIPH